MTRSPEPQAAGNVATVTPAGQQARAPADTQAANAAETKTPQTTAAASLGAVPPTTGQVSVTNAPSGATVTLDGRRQSSRQLTVRPGSHDLRIEASGFEPMARRIDVAAGDRQTVAFERRARTTTSAKTPVQTSSRQVASTNQGLATLRLIITPPGAVYIDGASKGQQSRVQEELVPGTHTLRVEKDGWVAKDTVVTVGVGQTATIRIQLTERRP